VNLRVPAALRDALAAWAVREHRSMSQQIVACLTNAVVAGPPDLAASLSKALPEIVGKPASRRKKR